jgi:hypothetical protein
VRGVASEVSPTAGFRVFCYCKDCQAFARFLDRADVLDAAGGTDIFQQPPGRVKLAAGADALRCVCLGNRGVFRWYADCCRTPIANTAGAGFPLIGVVHSFMDHAFMDDAFTESLAGGRSRDEVLGPPLCRIHERSATGPLPLAAPPPLSFGVSARRAAKALGWWLRGLCRPSPFFDNRTNAPRSVPRVLTRASAPPFERRAWETPSISTYSDLHSV